MTQLYKDTHGRTIIVEYRGGKCLVSSDPELSPVEVSGRVVADMILAGKLYAPTPKATDPVPEVWDDEAFEEWLTRMPLSVRNANASKRINDEQWAQWHAREGAV